MYVQETSRCVSELMLVWKMEMSLTLMHTGMSVAQGPDFQKILGKILSLA